MSTFSLRQLPQEPITSFSHLPFPKAKSGKVREIFDLGEYFLILATDRLSAFNFILPHGIPGKGILLTQLSLFWFKETESILKNHLVPNHDVIVTEILRDFPEIIPRSMIVKKLKPLSIESVVRAHLSGSAWKEYQKTGSVYDHALPSGLLESDRLPELLFTPTEKSQDDLPLTENACLQSLGENLFHKVKQLSLKLFSFAAKRSESIGLILADSKFEYGLDEEDNLYLIDEVFTPDCSRFWPRKSYLPGKAQPSFDKQIIRDYLESLAWDKHSPPPPLPHDIIIKTQLAYRHVLDLFLKTIE